MDTVVVGGNDITAIEHTDDALQIAAFHDR
jgi:hypothetical protein